MAPAVNERRRGSLPKLPLLRMPAFWDPLPAHRLHDCSLTQRERKLVKADYNKKISESLKAQDWCKKLDRQLYRMETSQMSRRCKAENEERCFDACKQQAEYASRMRDNLHTQERNLAMAMQNLKEKEICEAAFRKQLYDTAPEVQELERKIRAAYYAKTLYAQRIERESIKLEQRLQEHDNHEVLMEQLKQMEIEDLNKCKAEQQRKAEYMKILKEQMEGARSKQAIKLEDYQRDKELIDEIVEMIRLEETREKVEKFERIKQYQEEIQQAEDAQRQAKLDEQRREMEEERKIQEYLKSKSVQAANIAKEKEERNKVKAALASKAAEKILEEQMRTEELEDLRRELYQEMLEEEVRKRDAEEAAKKYKQMLELQEAEREAKMIRQKKLDNERKEIEQFKKQLMEKYAEDERLEQLSREKRRQKEMEHRKVIEEMIIERRARHAQEQEKLLDELRCLDAEAEQRRKYAQEEKLRLLRMHGPHILGFMPRGVITLEDIETLGEPFKTYYASLKRIPDPTTIDPRVDCASAGGCENLLPTSC